MVRNAAAIIVAGAVVEMFRPWIHMPSPILVGCRKFIQYHTNVSSGGVWRDSWATFRNKVRL